MSIICSKCGARLSDGVMFCTKCGQPVHDSNQGNNAPQNDGGSFEELKKAAGNIGKSSLDFVKREYDNVRENASQIDDGTGIGFTTRGLETCTGVKLAKGETVVRTYHATTYGLINKKKGYFTITNKRVMFESSSMGSRVVNEISLDSVSGFRNYTGRNIFIWGIIAGIIVLNLAFMFMGAIGMSSRYGGGGSAGALFGMLLCLAGAGALFFLSVRRTANIVVYSGAATGTPISIGEGVKTFLGNRGVYATIGRPTLDTNTMLREIGAMIMDLQTLGDQAIERWQVK